MSVATLQLGLLVIFGGNLLKRSIERLANDLDEPSLRNLGALAPFARASSF